MIESIFEGLVGTSGMKVIDWYLAHDLLINGVIVGLALLYVVFPAGGRRVNEFLRTRYQSSPLAPEEKDREAIRRTKELYKSRTSRRSGK
jgi:hypothetical protein